MIKILALLEKPSPKSFGLIPIVTFENASYQIRGLSPNSQFRAEDFKETNYQHLVLSGQALELKNIHVEALDSNAVALWVGTQFAHKAQMLSLPVVCTEGFNVESGTFYLGPSEKMFNYIEAWLDGAFVQFLKSNQKEIVSLMQWTLPGHMKTPAASWKTAINPEQELEMQLNIFAKGQNKSQWLEKLKELLN